MLPETDGKRFSGLRNEAVHQRGVIRVGSSGGIRVGSSGGISDVIRMGSSGRICGVIRVGSVVGSVL